MGNYQVRFRGRGRGYPTGSLRPYPTVWRIFRKSRSGTANMPPAALPTRQRRRWSSSPTRLLCLSSTASRRRERPWSRRRTTTGKISCASAASARQTPRKSSTRSCRKKGTGPGASYAEIDIRPIMPSSGLCGRAEGSASQ